MDKIIYRTAKESIGQKLSPIYKELGCVEALQNVLKKIGLSINDSPSTIKLYESLLSDRRFQRVTKPQIGDIILSPTSGLYIGHTGIVSDSGKVMSNNSRTLEWSEHLSISEWWYKYKNLPTVFFRYQENAIISADARKIEILKKIAGLYQQILLLLKSQKLGMNSKIFKLNYKDVFKGVIVACLSAVFLKLTTALNVPGFSFADYDWASLLQVAMASGMGYVAKQFFSDSNGTPLGSADR